MARRGARQLADGHRDGAAGRRPEPDRGRLDSSVEDVWIDEGPVDGQPGRRSPPRSQPAARERASLSPEVAEELARNGGGRAERDAKRLGDAARAYRRERYQEARRLLEPLARNCRDVGAVRELYGLTLYRLGRWKAAIAELEAAERLGGGLEHHPVLADCHRALGHHGEVQRLWEELRGGGAAAAVVVEGRIVAASALADRGNVAGGIALLEQGPVQVRKPREHHLRLWYVLADLYERAGDVSRARQLLRQVLEADPELPGALERYRSLG